LGLSVRQLTADNWLHELVRRRGGREGGRERERERERERISEQKIFESNLQITHCFVTRSSP
jgi:hypothetical protein